MASIIALIALPRRSSKLYTWQGTFRIVPTFTLRRSWYFWSRFSLPVRGRCKARTTAERPWPGVALAVGWTTFYVSMRISGISAAYKAIDREAFETDCLDQVSDNDMLERGTSLILNAVLSSKDAGILIHGIV